jgi:predicted component of type VI protein secretion system
VLAAANKNDLLKARAALAEVQTAMAEKESALAMAQTQLQQDRITLEGAQSWQARPSRRPRRL